ncbi:MULTISPECIES: hypothetical protein [Novosphingobium]|jgi:hypothetical protein|nr:hypothetical protein [Novosphingobium resinovorum]
MFERRGNSIRPIAADRQMLPVVQQIARFDCQRFPRPPMLDVAVPVYGID